MLDREPPPVTAVFAQCASAAYVKAAAPAAAACGCWAGLDSAGGHLIVDRSHASLDARALAGAYTVPCPAARDPCAPVELRVIVDRSIAEVHLADGQVLTLRFYPVADGPWRLQARTTGTGRSDFTVEAWHLNPGGIRQEPLLVSHGQEA